MKTIKFKQKLKQMLGEKRYDSIRLMFRIFKLRFNLMEDDSSTINFHKRIIHHNDTIFDIGSNKGFFTYNYSKIAKDGIIYSFEPIKTTYDLQQRLLRHFKLRNCRVNNFALSNMDGEVEFIMPKNGNYDSDTCATISTEGTFKHFKEKKIIKVQCRKTNSFLEQEHINLVHFVKIDVEGSELLVFKGADKLLKMQPIIFSEFLERHFEKFGYKSQDLINLLKTYNYRIYFYSKQFDGLILEEDCSDEYHTDCYFIPASREDELIESKVIRKMHNLPKEVFSV